VDYEGRIADMQTNRHQYVVVGHIDYYDVIMNGEHFGLTHDQNNVVAYYQVVKQTPERALLKNLFVVDTHRGQNPSAMFILFLKTQLHYKQIIIDYPAFQMRHLLKRLHSRFSVAWINRDSGQTRPYDDTTIDQYYDDMVPQDADLWTILVEYRLHTIPKMITEKLDPLAVNETPNDFYCTHFPNKQQDEEFMLPKHVSSWKCGK